jgi:hypothetical protein
MEKAFFQANEVCTACRGTGLYVGMAEHSGAAIVCPQCNGTGCYAYRHEYEVFTGRKDSPPEVIRVFQANPGICIGGDLRDFGGIPIEAWAAGLPFVPGTEDRKHTCPAWFYQTADYKKKPHWDACAAWGGGFSTCRNFPCKENCWERWDLEFGGKP